MQTVNYSAIFTNNYLILAACLFALFFSSYASAQSPSICIGYDPETESWGEIGENGFSRKGEMCPKGYAYLSQSRVGNPNRQGSLIPVFGACCKLPDDALIDFHEFVEEQCSPGFVATGGRTSLDSSEFEQCKYDNTIDCRELFRSNSHYFRCTQLNTNRYILGEETPLKYWGWPRHLSDLRQDRISKRDIPPALRFAIGRMGRFNWRPDGCIAWPPGSIVTRKSGRRCHLRFARQLQYRGIKGDPKAGTPVKVIPECSTISNRFDKDAYCVP